MPPATVQVSVPVLTPPFAGASALAAPPMSRAAVDTAARMIVRIVSISVDAGSSCRNAEIRARAVVGDLDAGQLLLAARLLPRFVVGLGLLARHREQALE